MLADGQHAATFSIPFWSGCSPIGQGSKLTYPPRSRQLDGVPSAEHANEPAHRFYQGSFAILYPPFPLPIKNFTRTATNDSLATTIRRDPSFITLLLFIFCSNARTLSVAALSARVVDFSTPSAQAKPTYLGSHASTAPKASRLLNEASRSARRHIHSGTRIVADGAQSARCRPPKEWLYH